MTQTVELELTQLPWQVEAYDSKARFKVYTKGRRAGGTSEAEDEVMEAVLRGEQVGWFFDIYKRLSKVWGHLTTTLQPVITKINVQEHRIEIRGGGSIAFWSCESSLTCRGFDFDLVVITESAHITGFKEIWQKEIRPTLFDRRGRAIFESSPNGYNYHETLHSRGQDEKFPKWASWQVPTTANPLISRKEIKEAEDDMDEAEFRQEVLAEFVTRSGSVFPMFRRALHVTEEAEYDPCLPLLMGHDFGLRRSATGFWQIVKSRGEARCIGEIGGRETDTEADMIAAREYGSEMWFSQNANGREPVDYFLGALQTIGCDPAGNARNPQTKIRDVEIMRATFPRVDVQARMPAKFRDPVEGAKMLRGMLKSASGKVRLFVHPRCRHHVKMFENLIHPKHKEGQAEKEEIVKDGVNDHWFDETRYILANVLWARERLLRFKP